MYCIPFVSDGAMMIKKIGMVIFIGFRINVFMRCRNVLLAVV